MKNRYPITFMDEFLTGNVTADEVDDWVDEWHDGGTNVPLSEFLGLNQEEYNRWVMKPNALEDMKKEHEEKRGGNQ